MVILVIAAILFSVLLIMFLIFMLYCYKTAFHSPTIRQQSIEHIPDGEQYKKWGPKMIEIAKIMEQASCEEITIRAKDDTKLFGRYYEYFPGFPVMIAFHGYRSMAFRDTAGAFALCQKLGFNILAVDQRAQGKSEGNRITFGILERMDCLDWVQYISTRLGSDIPIVLCGISMGAATVLMASDLKLPSNVVAIMADCPYDTPEGIIRKVAADMGYPSWLATPIIRLSARIIGGFSLRQCSPIDSVKYATAPILLIHGEEDRFVPCQMSRNIYAAAPYNCQLHTFPDAGHGLCYLTDPHRYETICVNFLWNNTNLRQYMKDNPFVIKIISE